MLIKDTKEKGLKKGMKKGIKQGIEQGSFKAKLEMAKNMIKEKIDFNLVARITGLSLEEIKKLETNY